MAWMKMKAGGCEKRRKKRLQRRGWAGYIDEGGGRGRLQITQSGARPGRGESEHEIKGLAPSHLGENQKRGKQHFQFPLRLQARRVAAAGVGEVARAGTSIAACRRDWNTNVGL